MDIDADLCKDRRLSVWTKREKMGRVIWSLVERSLFRLSFHNMYRWRALLLRLFGASVGNNVAVRRTVHIELPWRLSIGEWSSIGDHAIIYSLGKVEIGQRTTISQYTHLCAGTHDYSRPDMPLLCTPITIGHDCWIGTDAYIGPGVSIGDKTIVGARASVYKSVRSGIVCGGNPAKFIKNREPDESA